MQSHTSDYSSHFDIPRMLYFDSMENAWIKHFKLYNHLLYLERHVLHLFQNVFLLR